MSTTRRMSKTLIYPSKILKGSRNVGNIKEYLNIDIPRAPLCVQVKTIRFADVSHRFESNLDLQSVLPDDKCIVFISDLHLNSNTGKDDFTPQKLLFLDFLRALDIDSVELIVLLGDIFDIWEEPNVLQILINNAYTIKQLLAFNWVYVYGNHDDTMDLVCKSDILSIYGKIFAYHGHQEDPSCCKNSLLGRCASWLWAGLQCMGIEKWGFIKEIKRRVILWNSRRLSSGRTYSSSPTMQKIPDAYYNRFRQIAEPIAIFGHTHVPALEVKYYPFASCTAGDTNIFGRTKVIANCGSWTTNHQGSAIFLWNDRIELRIYKERIYGETAVQKSAD